MRLSFRTRFYTFLAHLQRLTLGAVVATMVLCLSLVFSASYAADSVKSNSTATGKTTAVNKSVKASKSKASNSKASKTSSKEAKAGAAKTSSKVNTASIALPDYIHRAQLNDTAESIAWKYLDQVQKKSNLQRFYKHNGIADSAARKKIKLNTPIKIPVAWMFLKPEAAVVLSSAGAHQFAATEGATMQALSQGQALPEGSYLKTGAQGGVSIGLPDGSRAAVPPNSELVLDTLRRYGQSDVFKIELKTLKGRVESTVKPLVHKAGSYEVKTRRSVTGVRGTSFNVEDNLDGNSLVEVLEGSVELVDANGKKQAVIAGNGTYIEKGSAAKPLFLLDAPDWAGVGTDFVPADKVLPVITVPGTAQVRVDVFVGTDDTVKAFDSPAYTRSGSLAMLPADVPDGTYVLGIRSIDKNGLQGFPLRKEVRVTRVLLPPEVTWQVVNKQISWKPTVDAKAFTVQVRKANLAANAASAAKTEAASPTRVGRVVQTNNNPLIINQNQAVRLLDLSPLAADTYEFRIASTDGPQTGPYSPWVSIAVPK